MRTTVIRPRLFQAGTLKFEIYDSRESAGRAAALAAAEEMTDIDCAEGRAAMIGGKIDGLDVGGALGDVIDEAAR